MEAPPLGLANTGELGALGDPRGWGERPRSSGGSGAGGRRLTHGRGRRRRRRHEEAREEEATGGSEGWGGMRERGGCGLQQRRRKEAGRRGCGGMEELGFVLSAILYPWNLIRAIGSAMNGLK